MLNDDDDRDRLAGWEIASWTLTCLIALVILAAAIQTALDDREWSHIQQPAPPAQTRPMFPR